MRHLHLFWRTLITLAGAFAIVFAWRLAVATAWQWSQPPGGDLTAWTAQARVWLEWRTLWVPATLIAAWGGYLIGGAAWFVWWLLCLRLAWSLAQGVLAAVETGAVAAQVPAGDLPAAWMLAMMPIAGGLVGSLLGKRSLTYASEDNYELPAPSSEDAASRDGSFRRRDDAYRP